MPQHWVSSSVASRLVRLPSPSNSDPDGKFRAISVRVRDSKLGVSAKRGYWATGTSN